MDGDRETSTRRVWRSSWWLSATLTAIALVPYLTQPVSFELGLRLQAGLILSALCGVGLWYHKRILAALAEMPRAVRIGLTLYAGAALWGGVVGFASGNPSRYLLGQLVSMLLLPAAAIAFAAAPRSLGRHLATGLACAASIALAVHLGVAALGFEPSAAADLPSIFKLPNGVDFVSPALLATVLAAAWWTSERAWIALVGGLAGSVLILGGMSRAQWLATLVAALVLGVTLRRWSRKRLAILGAVTASCLLVVALLLWWSSHSGVVLVRESPGRSQPDEAPAPGPDDLLLHAVGGRSAARRLAVTEIPAGVSAVEARVLVRGTPGKTINLWLTGRPSADAPLTRRWNGSLLGSGTWSHLSLFAKLPDDVEWLGVGVRTAAGDWHVTSLRVTAYESELAWWLRRLSWRAHTLARAFEAPDTVGTLRYRIQEWQSIHEEWRRSSWQRILVGHGLGAVFSFKNVGWDDRGRRISLPEASYTHNFYVFLGFKLGLAGLAGLCGLLILVGWTARRAWMVRNRSDCWFAAAAAAAWVAYLLWSVTSPEILSFRMAPLWGVVVAATWKSLPDESILEPADEAETRTNEPESSGRTTEDGGTL